MGYRKNKTNRASGTVDLTVGVDAGTVVDEFDSAPARIFLSVQGPEEADVIFANYVGGTASDTGFDFQLSAAPTVAGYKLNYICDF